MNINEYVQFGCGLCAPNTWRNFDASPTLRMQKIPLVKLLALKFGNSPIWPDNVEYGDIVRGLPIQNNSVKVIYCSHVLEHLALEDFRMALRNIYGYLMDGGIFRFVLPDLETLISAYSASDDPEAAHRFMSNSYLGERRRPKGVEGAVRTFWGNSKHLWMWDFASISKELLDTGFTNIRRSKYGDSADPKFADVEDKGRWKDALGVECQKVALKA